MNGILDPFSLEFMQRAALEIVLLAPLAGLLGAQIVLRQLAFYTHGVGTAAFPGLVIAGPAGIPPSLAALGVGILFAGSSERLARGPRIAADAATALILVAALAIGIVLASDVFESGSEVDQLLFGSLLAIGDRELLTSAAALAVAVLATVVWRRAWVGAGFDPVTARSLGLGSTIADWALLSVIAVAVIAAIDATGALLVGAILVVPAATARLLAGSVGRLEFVAGAVALAEGVAGLWLAYELDVPPGAAIATLGGAVFALVALARSIATGGAVARSRS
jgi:ABC-type Mn2+/Zn2+ transport system permease subunit